MSWLDSFFKSLATRVQDHGALVPYEQNINFLGGGVTVTDDPANSRTNVTINGAASLNTVTATLAQPGGSNGYFSPVGALGTLGNFGGSTSLVSGPGSAGVDQLSLSITTTGGNIRVFYSFSSITYASNTATTAVAVFVDGTGYALSIAQCSNQANLWVNVCNSYDVTSIAAGVHTVSLRWCSDIGTGKIGGGPTSSLTALELK